MTRLRLSMQPSSPPMAGDRPQRGRRLRVCWRSTAAGGEEARGNYAMRLRNGTTAAGLSERFSVPFSFT